MVYNYGATAMPERYDNHFWICNFGGAKGDLEAFSVKPEGAGFALDHHEVFMVGLVEKRICRGRRRSGFRLEISNAQ